MNEKQWEILMQSLGIEETQETYGELYKAYSEKHRHYHTVNHIKDCLEKFDSIKHFADDSAAIEVAIWFHDAVYKPFSSKNELDSSNWAASFLSQNNVEKTFTDRVHKLIMATRHDTQSLEHDSSLLIDIDLSILGEEEEKYRQFEKDVRKEYRWVPFFVYRKKRCAILNSFLNRKRIFSNIMFYELYEERARINIKEAIKMLQG